MTTQDEIFWPFMVPRCFILVFGVDTIHVKTENLSHMWPVLLNKRFFFLLSLFAPLNGIQQLEDISDTRFLGFFSTCFFVPYGHNFCVTALPSWRFWLGTLAQGV